MLRTTRTRLERLEESSPPLPPRVIVLTLLPASTSEDRQRHLDQVGLVTGREVSARDALLVLARDDAARHAAVTVNGVVT